MGLLSSDQSSISLMMDFCLFQAGIACISCSTSILWSSFLSQIERSRSLSLSLSLSSPDEDDLIYMNYGFGFLLGIVRTLITYLRVVEGMLDGVQLSSYFFGLICANCDGFSGLITDGYFYCFNQVLESIRCSSTRSTLTYDNLFLPLLTYSPSFDLSFLMPQSPVLYQSSSLLPLALVSTFLLMPSVSYRQRVSNSFANLRTSPNPNAIKLYTPQSKCRSLFVVRPPRQFGHDFFVLLLIYFQMHYLQKR